VIDGVGVIVLVAVCEGVCDGVLVGVLVKVGVGVGVTGQQLPVNVKLVILPASSVNEFMSAPPAKHSLVCEKGIPALIVADFGFLLHCVHLTVVDVSETIVNPEAQLAQLGVDEGVIVGVIVGVAVLVGVILGVTDGVAVIVGVGVGEILQAPPAVIYPFGASCETEPFIAQIVVDAPKHKLVVPELPSQFVQLKFVQAKPPLPIV